MIQLPTHSFAVREKIANLEKICGHDVGRGIQPLVKYAQGGLLKTACSLLEHPKTHVAILTGFYLPHGIPPAAETDGPIGCVQLGASLARIGIKVRIVTDSLCFGAIKHAAIAIGISTSVEFDVVPVSLHPQAKLENENAVYGLMKIWQQFASPITHLISIERPGVGRDGKTRNMRGDDISQHTAPLHLLFNLPNAIKIGIGDGGNEIGMGNIPRSIIKTHIRHGEKIACMVPCDFLLVCGVSNWGAAAILIAIALLRPQWQNKLLATLNPETEFLILETLVNQALAVDGVTGQASLTVDNLPWEYHAQFLSRVKQILLGK